MYQDTVTIFNKYESTTETIWYPTTLHNVDLNADRGAIARVYGSDSTDNARLHVKFNTQDGLIYVGNKPYYPPKEWATHLNDDLPGEITFKPGDFFINGEYANTPVNDDDTLDGFYTFINRRYDDCYVITSVGRYSVIPHFEILAK